MKCRILAVEDSATQAEQLRALLEDAGHEVVLARSGEEALERLGASDVDLVLSDVMMPGITGFELCRRIKGERPELPVLLLTSLTSPMDIVRGLEAGSDNYITKPYEPEHLLARIRRVLDNRRLREGVRTSMGVNITFLGNTFTITSEREQILDLLLSSVEDTVRANLELEERQRELADAHARLEMYATQQAREARRSSERYRVLMQNAGDAIFVLDEAGSVMDANECAADLLGRPLEQVLYREFANFVGPEPSVPRGAERALTQPDGEVVWIELSSSVTSVEDETFTLVIARDITERKRNEEALRRSQEELQHSQRLEAIGRLSGGIAHDFNNILTTIQGSTQLLLMELPSESDIREELEEIDRAAARATGLTRQLLAFSRKQVFQPRVLDVNAVVREMEGMLHRLAGEKIRLEFDLDPELRRTRADVSQIQQVIVNLAVNARDAMASGGTLSIRTHNTPPGQGVLPGPAVQLSVLDTGAGIPDDVREQIFEPFFTTKGMKGTGLGLSTVYGIVKQSGGTILIDSSPGNGSRFDVFLPSVEEEADPVVRAAPSKSVPGRETILLVEDEEPVRKLAVRILTKQGYTVLDAPTGEAALEVLREAGPIDLLVTDLMLPGMGGAELAAAVSIERPNVPVLYMSGYTDDTIVEQGILKPGVRLLEKPFTPQSFVQRIREVLEPED